MKHRHHVHRHKHGMHKNDGGSIPSHVAGGSAEYKRGGHVKRHHRARGGGLVHDEEHGNVHDEEGGKTSHTDAVPPLVSGNPVVVKAAKETKSIGEVPGIYAKKRLDRKSRAGAYDANSLVAKVGKH